jgi:hypothetical protein
LPRPCRVFSQRPRLQPTGPWLPPFPRSGYASMLPLAGYGLWGTHCLEWRKSRTRVLLSDFAAGCGRGRMRDESARCCMHMVPNPPAPSPAPPPPSPIRAPAHPPGDRSLHPRAEQPQPPHTTSRVVLLQLEYLNKPSFFTFLPIVSVCMPTRMYNIHMHAKDSKRLHQVCFHVYHKHSCFYI